MNENDGVDVAVDDFDVQPVTVGNRVPVLDAGSTQRVDADANACTGNGVHVDNRAKRVNVRAAQVLFAADRGLLGSLRRQQPAYVGEAGRQDLVRPLLDDRRDVGIRRPARGRVVLEATILGRIVGRRDHDAVGQRVARLPVVVQDRERNHRRRRVLRGFGVDQLHTIRGEHLHGRRPRRLRQRVGVPAHDEWTRDTGGLTVLDNRLTDGQDVVLVEAPSQRRTAVTRRAERHPLRWLHRVRFQHAVRIDESCQIDMAAGRQGLACPRICHHLVPPCAGQRRVERPIMNSRCGPPQPAVGPPAAWAFSAH
jgi:hypothetical protein